MCRDAGTDIRGSGLSGYQHISSLRQIIVFVVSIVLIAGSVFWIVRSFAKNDDSEEKPAIYLYCTGCNSLFEPEERLGGEHPRLCDRCGKRAAWFAVQCRDCREICAMAPEEDENGRVVQGRPMCPNGDCRSGNWHMYDPSINVPLR